jgi:alkaline phosphatase D
MQKPPHLKRRTLVKGLAASSLIPLLGANLVGCSDSSDRVDSVAADFLHGVASGDPLADRVILWTRLTPETEGRVVVQWEVARDEAFNDVVASGRGSTDASVDYTLKVDAAGLSPDSSYYYRFTAGDNTSPVGRTRTLPTGSVAAVSFAVVSCSNYPAGYFNVYREIVAEDVDAVLHLGDYLYEYAPGGYASDRAEEFGRVVEPANEIVSLQDYRTRYSQYRSDGDLQAVHAAHPFILVWDDHEVTNDAWREGAENHQPETEGDYEERKRAAIQAWYEWLPVRPPSMDDDAIIYRRFEYGDLVDLIMLDTRIIGRDEQYVLNDFATDGILDVDAARAALNDSGRTLLGATQRDWLDQQLINANAHWQVLGQQVLLSRYPLPAKILESLDPGIGGDFNEGVAALLASVAAKQKAPEDRTPEEQALLDSAIPYNPDAWDGYGFERDALLDQAGQLGRRLITLAGDTHNAWASQLRNTNGDIVGAELATASVSSPGLEGLLGAAAAAQFAPLLEILVDDLVYTNLSDRGYLRVTLTREAATADWRFVSAIDSPDYEILGSAARTLSVDADTLALS